MQLPTISPERLLSCSRGLLLGMACGELTVSGTQLATEMAADLGDSLLATARLSPQDLAARWAERLPQYSGRSNSITKQALQLRQSGFEVADLADAAARLSPLRDGDGPLTRGLPLAIFCHRDLSRLKSWAVSATAVTHASRASQVASMASCLLARDLMARQLEDSLARAAQAIREESPAPVVAALHLPDRGEGPPDGDDAPAVLAAAVFAVSTGPGLETVLSSLVGRWLSSDSSGALAGALAGSHWGAEAIPEAMLTALPATLRSRLEELAAALVEAALPEPGAPAPTSTPGV